MNLLVVGLSHRTAPLTLREQCTLSAHEVPEALQALRRRFPLEGALVLSTCNRFECYVASAAPLPAPQDLIESLIPPYRRRPSSVEGALYALHDREAVAHCFRVAAGLDSMIVGESEITAQVKHAHVTAHEQKAIGPLCDRLIQKALHSAKVVRSQTGIARGGASIGSVVSRLAAQLFGPRLAACDVLLWGAGQAAESTARHLIKRGIHELWIVNRTAAKAQELATLCRGGWLSWEQAVKHLGHVDIAIVCTQAPHHVLDEADVAQILPQRRGRPLLLSDLAVPRNIDPSVKRHPGVQVHNIDDLSAIAQAGLRDRREELARCEMLIQEQVAHFWRWWRPLSEGEEIRCPDSDPCVSASRSS